MERSGEIIVAWPEDYVVMGEELVELTERLAPRADILSQDLGRTAVTTRAFSECEAAIKDTLGLLDRGMSTRNLETIINVCWERTDVERDHKRQILSRRRQTLSLAFWRLLNRNEIETGEDYLVRLIPVHSSTSSE